MTKGYLITINGISSSGKTTTATFLQKIINKELVGAKKHFKSPFLLLHMDDFTKGVSEKYRLSELQRKNKKDIPIELMTVVVGSIKSVQIFIDMGVNVIFEGAYGNLIHQLIKNTFSSNCNMLNLSDGYKSKSIRELIKDQQDHHYSVRLVRSLKSLKENEIKRKNVIGMAEAQYQDQDYQKLINKDFDLNLKVDGLNPAEVVATIFKDYFRKLEHK